MFKVLIVDDEPIVKIALRSIIPWEKHGFEICATASNGEEALSLARKYKPDIIITDLVMPVMNGIQFIQTLKKNDYAGEIIVISNHEDFQYVRSALVMGVLDYILKISISEAQLLTQLNKAVEKLNAKHKLKTMQETLYENQELYNKKRRQIMLKNYITNIDTIPDDEYSELQSDTEDFPALFCYLSLEKYLQSEAEPLSGTLIENTLLEFLPHFEKGEILFLSSYSILLLLPIQELESKNLIWRQWLLSLPKHFELCMSVSPIIIYYDNVTDYVHCKEIYTLAQSIMQLSFYGNLCVVNAKEYRPVHYLSTMYYKELSNLIAENKYANLDKTLELIDSIISKSQNSHVYPEILKMYFIKTIEFLSFISDNQTLETHDFLSETLENIRFCTNVPDLKVHIRLSIQAILQPIPDGYGKDNNYKEEINLVLKYISQNYMHKISLSTLSEYAKLSSSYFCRIFKAEVGISATNYINQLRMEKAKKLMEKDSISIKEISISVGIDDQLYFSRLFKKHYGITPSDYRNSLSYNPKGSS